MPVGRPHSEQNLALDASSVPHPAQIDIRWIRCLGPTRNGPPNAHVISPNSAES